MDRLFVGIRYTQMELKYMINYCLQKTRYFCHSYDLLKALYTENKTKEQFGMKIPLLQSKVMAFKGQVPIRNTTVTDKTILEIVNMFIHLECKISHEEENNFNNTQVLQNMAIVNNVLKLF
jgi:hypothetical protein